MNLILFFIHFLSFFINFFLFLKKSYSDQVDPKTNKTYTELRSPTMRTPIVYYVQAAAGFHYCKLLSPARAMEWLYVDSLKP
jgi:hypothetical protein